MLREAQKPTESKDPESAGVRRDAAGILTMHSTRENSRNRYCRDWGTRGPSTTLPSLRDDNSAQDDKGEGNRRVEG